MPIPHVPTRAPSRRTHCPTEKVTYQGEIKSSKYLIYSFLHGAAVKAEATAQH